MTATTLVPYLNALVAAAQANGTLTALCNVYDGQPITSDPTNYLSIGFREGNDDLAGSGQTNWRAMSRTLEGTYEIPCEISTMDGDHNASAARTAAQAIYDAFWAVLLPAGQRGGATALAAGNVIGAVLDGWEMRVRKDPSIGTSVFFGFNVVVREYITSS